MAHNIGKNSCLLTQILDDSNEQSLFIFDLDSTLFDVSPRIEAIIHQFASQASVQKRFPDCAKKLIKSKILPSDWGIYEALKRAGIKNKTFVKELELYWEKLFFSNEFLKYDKPFPGSVEFINSIAQKKGFIIYLTGRVLTTMQKGTLDSLAHWGFPLAKAQIMLKPNITIKDFDFKKEALNQLHLKHDQTIWFFENEPININMTLRFFPTIYCVLIESTHCGKETVPSHVPRIKNFLTRTKKFV